jgi:hypothetical protein
MKAFSVLDNAVIARHQRLVDWSRRHPAWWQTQCGIGSLVFAAALGGLAALQAAGMATFMPWAAGHTVVLCSIWGSSGLLLVVYARSAPMAPHGRLGGSLGRIARLSLLLLSVGGMILTLFRANAGAALIDLQGLVVLAAFYFDACNPPRLEQDEKPVGAAPLSHTSAA